MGKLEKGLRYNEGKLKWSLVYYKAVEEMIKVLMFGAKKYSANNWKKGFKRSELLECMQRHVVCIMKGEENDDESGFHHIGHVMCNCMMYFYHHINNSFLPEDDES